MFNLTWGNGLFWAAMIFVNILIYFLVKFKIKQAFTRGQNLGNLKGHREGLKEGHSNADSIWRVRMVKKIGELKRDLKIREVLLTIAETAGLLGIKTKKLYHMRCDGKGPDFILLGGKPFYRQVEVERWQRAQGEADSPGSPDEAPPDCMNARGGAATR